MTGLVNCLDQAEREEDFENFEEETKDRYDKSLKSVKKEKDKVIDSLKEQIAKFENLNMKYLENEDKFLKLFDLEEIDNQGEFIPYKPRDEDEMS